MSDRVLSGVEIAWLTGGWVVHMEACLVLGKECYCWAVGCLFDDLIGVRVESVEPSVDCVHLMGPLSKRSFEHGG